jgi:hypothetical protein
VQVQGTTGYIGVRYFSYSGDTQGPDDEKKERNTKEIRKKDKKGNYYRYYYWDNGRHISIN